MNTIRYPVIAIAILAALAVGSISACAKGTAAAASAPADPGSLTPDEGHHLEAVESRALIANSEINRLTMELDENKRVLEKAQAEHEALMLKLRAAHHFDDKALIDFKHDYRILPNARKPAPVAAPTPPAKK